MAGAILPQVRKQLFASSPAVVPLVGAIVLVLYVRAIDFPAAVPAAFAASVGGTVLLLLYVATGIFTNKWNLSELYSGQDGRPSTSKFQALIWTVAVVFSYSGFFALRATLGRTAGMLEIPQSLMLAMGFSFTTLAAAKGITVSYVNAGRITKTEAKPGEATSVAQEDDGGIDLTKVQMLWWTFIAVAVYLFQVFQQFDQDGRSTLALPDIDATLMVLMGLSQGVYVGKKLVTTDTPVLNPLSIAGGPPATPITINGTAFGALQGTSQLTIDGVPIVPASWTDSQIVFTLPQSHPVRGPWKSHQQVSIDVIVNGRSGITPVIFTVVLPSISKVTPTPMQGQKITIDGSGFGTTAIAARSVTIGGTPVIAEVWSDQQIVATVPAGKTSPVEIIVTVGSTSSAPFTA